MGECSEERWGVGRGSAWWRWGVGLCGGGGGVQELQVVSCLP